MLINGLLIDGTGSDPLPNAVVLLGLGLAALLVNVYSVVGLQTVR